MTMYETAKSDAKSVVQKAGGGAAVGGAAGAAALGFFVAGPIGAGIGALVGYLGGKKFGGAHGMTPVRKKIYEEALKSLKDPIKLRKLADTYDSEGLHEEATLLRKRAALREIPPEQKAARRDAFRRALSVGKDGVPVTGETIQKIETLAATFHNQGATGNAAALRQHAAGLRKIAGL